MTRGEGGLRLPSALVWVAGVTLISSEEVVRRKFIDLSVVTISRGACSKLVLYCNNCCIGQCLVFDLLFP